MAKRKKKAPLFKNFDTSRKMEITGVLVMAISVLLFLSIVSYHPEDFALVKQLSGKEAGQASHNWLNVAGAYIAYLFVYTMFGYVSVIIPVLLGVTGWSIFRSDDLNNLKWPVIYGLWMMLLISVTLGWFHAGPDYFSLEWAGNLGVFIAEQLQAYLGVGSIILLTVFLLVSVMVIVDRDLQRTMDRPKEWIDALKKKRALSKEKKKADQAIQARQDAEEAERLSVQRARTQAGGPSSEIDDILKRSEVEDRQRELERRKEAEEMSSRPPRAILERPETGASGMSQAAEGDEEAALSPDDDDLEMSVFVGQGEQEADARELERQNKVKAKEMPVIKYKFPGIDLLDSPPNDGNEVDMEEIRLNKKIILDKLRRHKIEILSINAIVGPTVTLYELEPAPDVKISKIESYASDLKMATAAHGLRIIAPIPGRSAVGIEVPNKTRETVYIKSVINTKKFVETSYHLPVAMGKTIENEVFMIDLTRMPHLLIAGATGSGKSVGINTIITCLLYKCHPDNLKFVLIDPKKIELSLYRNIQNHFLAVLPGSDEPIVTDTSQALETLQSVTMEMDERYDLLKMAMVRDIRAYNEKFDSGELDEELGHRHLPYIVVIIDELADLMMTAGKQIEEPIARIAQLARAIGIHLVVATQRPSVNVITGTIKANFPARVAYQVASRVDSRTILDTGGADQLVGSGDMLFSSGSGMIRIQNAFVSTEEVEEITSFIGNQRGYKSPFYLPVVQQEGEGIPDPLDDIDEYFKEAARIVVLHQQGSVSLLQRKLKIGYNRAGRIIDQLYNAEIVGPFQGSTARDVKVTEEEELSEIFKELGI